MILSLKMHIAMRILQLQSLGKVELSRALNNEGKQIVLLVSVYRIIHTLLVLRKIIRYFHVVYGAREQYTLNIE